MKSPAIKGFVLFYFSVDGLKKLFYLWNDVQKNKHYKIQGDVMKIRYLLLAITLLFCLSNAQAGTGDYTLQYGGQTITLNKDPVRIAVKPSATVRKGQSVLGKRAGEFKKKESIGGFEVFKYEGPHKNVDRDLDSIRKRGATDVGTHVYHMGNQAVPLIPTGEIFLRFTKVFSKAIQDSVLSKFALELVETRDKRTFILKTTAASPNPLKVAESLQKNARIEVVEPELTTLMHVKKKKSKKSKKSKNTRRVRFDSQVKDQWHLLNRGRHRGTTQGLRRGADARVVDAWKVLRTELGKRQQFGSENITVAIIDDGFDLSHPDLSGESKIVQPWDFTRRNNSPLPDHSYGDWHGTACAGVAVGNRKGGDILGVAPMVKFMPLRWGMDLSDREVESWFDYARENGADVVSCSWGAAASYFPLSTRISEALTRCATEGRGGKGCVILFAAGNDDRNVNDPSRGLLDGFATHPHVIAVAASDSMDQKAYYSNYGKEIAFCAPSSGEMGILTADVGGSGGYNPGDYDSDFGGTSSSCPLAAGVAALVLSANPNLTRDQVVDILTSTARKIGKISTYVDGHSIFYGHGCVNAGAAVTAALAQRS